MTEEWKVYINGKRVKWEVSDQGNAKRNGILVEFDDSQPYYVVGGFKVHRAVAELFIPNPENKQCVDHIDTDRHNNAVWNLRWCTQKENCNNPLTKKHISDTQREVWSNIELKQKHGKIMKEVLNRPEVKQKRAEVTKKMWNNPEYRQKNSEAQKVAQNKPEVQKKISNAMSDRTWVNKNNTIKFIKKDQLSLFLNKGWKLGRK